MLRWETVLESENCVVCVDPVSKVEELYSLSHYPEKGHLVLPGDYDITTYIQISHEEKNLVLRFAVSKKTKSLPKELAPEWYYRDHMVFMLDMDHSHSVKYLIGVTRDGETVVSQSLAIPGEFPSDGPKNKPAPSTKEPEPEIAVQETDKGWGGEIRILLHEGVPVIGLLVKSGGAGETWRPRRRSAWPPPWRPEHEGRNPLSRRKKARSSPHRRPHT